MSEGAHYWNVDLRDFLLPWRITSFKCAVPRRLWFPFAVEILIRLLLDASLTGAIDCVRVFCPWYSADVFACLYAVHFLGLQSHRIASPIMLSMCADSTRHVLAADLISSRLGLPSLPSYRGLAADQRLIRFSATVSDRWVIDTFALISCKFFQKKTLVADTAHSKLIASLYLRPWLSPMSLCVPVC